MCVPQRCQSLLHGPVSHRLNPSTPPQTPSPKPQSVRLPLSVASNAIVASVAFTAACCCCVVVVVVVVVLLLLCC